MGKQPVKNNAPRQSKSTPDLPPQVPPTRVLDETYWLQFSKDPNPSTRQKMMYVTIDDVARIGPVSFNALTMCDEVGVSDGLLNFHFGSRNELLAETLVWVYQRFVNEVAESVGKAKQDPEIKLRAWITAVHQGFVKMGGWGVLVNYPIASREVSYLAEHQHGKEFVDMAELNLALLLHLISDFKKGKVTEFALEAGKIPKSFFMKNPGLTALTVSVALSTSGMAVWQGGRTEGQAKKEGSIMDKMVIKTHVDRIIKSIS
jgi:AcrR family transcriptional regulator